MATSFFVVRQTYFNEITAPKDPAMNRCLYIGASDIILENQVQGWNQLVECFSDTKLKKNETLKASQP